MKFTGIVCTLLIACAVSAQTVNSGSTGSDGALTYTTPGTYIFDPKAFTPPLNPSGDCIFNFTTINIAAGVTVKLRGDILNCPVTWLASGAVRIDGTVDVSGQDGFAATNTTQRTYTVPGAGGYGGGYPSIGSNPTGAGLGPAGGLPNINSGCGVLIGISGGVTANQFAVPLVGGSGGGGAASVAGGAGGGAVLIASSVSISGVGSILAVGGGGRYVGAVSGPGAGGTIRLVAPTVTLSGLVNASGGAGVNSCNTASQNGVVRVEAYTIGSINSGGQIYTATPFGLFVNSSAVASISVVSVGGVPVAANPTGAFIVPDVTVNSTAPLAFAVKAANVPLGTVVTLQIFSENGPDQTIQTTPLAGTVASSSATASATLPPGFSKGFVTASW